MTKRFRLVLLTALSAICMTLLSPSVFADENFGIKVTTDKNEVEPGESITYEIKAIPTSDISKMIIEIPKSTEFKVTSAQNEFYLRESDYEGNYYTFELDGFYDTGVEESLLTVTAQVADGTGETENITPEFLITVYDWDNNRISCTVDTTDANVAVVLPSVSATSLSLNKNEITIKSNETYQLTATAEPTDTTDEITWYSETEAVATVDENGLVTAHKSGETVIVARCGELRAECKITVECAHDFGGLIPSTTTCTSDGIARHYQCKNCGRLFDEDKNLTDLEQLKEDKKEHNYTDLIPEVSADCTKAGTKAHYKCTACGGFFNLDRNEVEYEDLTIPQKEHEYSKEWHSDENGHWRECKNCKAETEHEEHTCNEVNCEEKSVCTICGKEYGEVKDHSLKFVSEKPSTCNEKGVKSHYECENCGKKFKENKQEIKSETELKIPKSEHTPSENLQSDNIAHWYECENCEEKLNYETHKDGSATCKEKAICQVCGTEYGDYARHNLGDLIPEINPTCETDGRKAYRQCNDCKELFDENGNKITSNQLAISKLNHKLSDMMQSDETKHWRVCENRGCTKIFDEKEHGGGKATCLSRAICEDCGKAYGEKADHEYGELIKEVKPTCETDGIKVHYNCRICGETFNENKEKIKKEELKTEKINHKLSDKPVADEKNHRYFCVNEGCDKKFDEKPHNFDYGTVTKQPGYDENQIGEKVYKCAECGYEKTEPIPVLTNLKTYKIVNGANKTIDEKPTEIFTVRSNAGIDKFIRVEVDEEIVDPENYTLKEGSTIIEFKPEYLATLEPGKHTICVVSQDGTAQTNLRIKALPAEKEQQTEKTTTAKTTTKTTKTTKSTKSKNSPKTNDFTPVLPVVGMTLLTLSMVLLSDSKRKDKSIYKQGKFNGTQI